MVLLSWMLMNIAQVIPLSNFQNQACQSQIVRFNYNSIKLMPRAKGMCTNCCKLDLRRDVSLTFYSKEARHGVRLSNKNGALRRAGLRANESTIFYIHGFVELGRDGRSAKTVAQAYVDRPEWNNVIVVDWSELSAGPWYQEAVYNTKIVGALLGYFIRKFLLSGELQRERLHLIGFSLGAHVAGFAGQHLNRFMQRPPRITGLDPAFPLFVVTDVDERLSPDDADFVDVIHTNPIVIGFPYSIGDVDVYVNPTEEVQPGCLFHQVVANQQLDDFFSCSHQRAWQIYAMSVRRPLRYSAVKCKMLRISPTLKCSRRDRRLRTLFGFGQSRPKDGNYIATIQY